MMKRYRMKSTNQMTRRHTIRFSLWLSMVLFMRPLHLICTSIDMSTTSCAAMCVLRDQRSSKLVSVVNWLIIEDARWWSVVTITRWTTESPSNKCLSFHEKTLVIIVCVVPEKFQLYNTNKSRKRCFLVCMTTGLWPINWIKW